MKYVSQPGIGALIRERLGPATVFVGTMAAVGWLYVDFQAAPTVVGFAHGVEYDIAPLDTGRVVSVAVDIGQQVSEGAVIAVLDSSEIDSEIAVAEAERARADARITAAAAQVRREAGERERGLMDDLARLERSLAEARAEQATASAERKAREAERQRLADLVEQRLADGSRLGQLEARVATLRARSEGTRGTVRLLERQVEELRTRVDAVTRDEVEIAVGPLRRQLDVIDSRLARLRTRRANLVLRAPAAGRVAEVDLHPGDVAGPQREVVTLVAPGAGRVVACLAEDQALDVRTGDPATLWLRKSGRRDPMAGRVVGLGPLVDTLPTRCRPNLRDKVWGRDVVILLDQAVDLLPGQALDVRITHGEGATLRGARAAAPAPVPGEPIAIEVPAELRRRSAVEPSGLLWVPHLARYLVVTDDTGPAGSDEEHAPWLLALDGRGQLDPHPVAIHGVERVSDLEGIAPGRGDVLYLLASQSFSRNGKRPDKRQAFLRLRPDEGGYVVSGAVKLAALLDALPPGELLRTLGIADTAALDVEGLTEHEGALLMGVKAPLDDQGRALIWRLDRPDRLFHSGRLEPGDLRLWARVPLHVQADGEQTPAGISELLFLPDGSLLLAATAPGAPDTQSGALWWAPEAQPGELVPRHVRTFEGLKPEGLALAPTPGRLKVAFDRGSEAPLWVELPWPRR